MELNDLKTAWQSAPTPQIAVTDIEPMLSANNHPVLKGIRRQVMIEVAVWVAFLLCYYTMFDGDRKPVWINAILIVSVLLPLAHNLAGYSFARYLVNGTSLKASLKAYLSKVKVYAVVSVMSRALFAAGLLVFFTYGLAFNGTRYYLIAVVAVVYLAQLIILYRMWAGRLHKIKATLQQFG